MGTPAMAALARASAADGTDRVQTTSATRVRFVGGVMPVITSMLGTHPTLSFAACLDCPVDARKGLQLNKGMTARHLPMQRASVLRRWCACSGPNSAGCCGGARLLSARMRRSSGWAASTRWSCATPSRPEKVSVQELPRHMTCRLNTDNMQA